MILMEHIEALFVSKRSRNARRNMIATLNSFAIHSKTSAAVWGVTDPMAGPVVLALK